MVVYLVVNRVNLKPYVGITTAKLRDRLNKHLSPTSQSPLSRAIKKHGFGAFDVGVLETCGTLQELRERECFWIERIGSFSPAGYNLTLGGGGTPGVRRSEDYLRKMSETRKGADNPNYGNHSSWSEARRAAVPAEHHSKRPEIRARLRETTQLSWNSGERKNSESERERLRALGRDVLKDPAVRERHLAAIRAYHEKRKAAGIPGSNAGKTLSPEVRERVSAGTKKAMQRPEVRERFMAAQNLRYGKDNSNA